MRKYMDYDTGEIWTEKELLDEFFRYDGKDENGVSFEDYLEEALKEGQERTGGLIEIDDDEDIEQYLDEGSFLWRCKHEIYN